MINSDHDLLVRIDERVGELQQDMRILRQETTDAIRSLDARLLLVERRNNGKNNGWLFLDRTWKIAVIIAALVGTGALSIHFAPQVAIPITSSTPSH